MTPGPTRYGVFLLPDAPTSAAVTAITAAVRAQYGLVSAQRFPPHVTLAGSLPLAVAEEDLLASVAAVAGRHPAFTVHNAGVGRLGEAVVFDVDRGTGGRRNAALRALAADVATAVAPLLRPVGPDEMPADVRGPEDWRGHLSLASHELFARVDLRDEVEEFVRALDVPRPAEWRATTLAVYRLDHPSWAGTWWTDFRWEHVRSVRLPDGERPT